VPAGEARISAPALLSTEERSQYAENQLEQDPSSGRELTPSVLWSMLNRIFGTHSHRSLAAYRISGFPTAEHFETSAMPSQDGLRLNHLGRTKKARPEPRHPGEQGAVTVAQSTTRRRPPQCDVELMTEKQILSFKPAPRLE
jgi:hypothetical protein